VREVVEGELGFDPAGGPRCAPLDVDGNSRDGSCAPRREGLPGRRVDLYRHGPVLVALLRKMSPKWGGETTAGSVSVRAHMRARATNPSRVRAGPKMVRISGCYTIRGRGIGKLDEVLHPLEPVTGMIWSVSTSERSKGTLSR